MRLSIPARFLLLAALAGCQSPGPAPRRTGPSPEEIAAAELGAPPAHAEAAIRAHLERLLADSGEVELDLGEVEKGAYRPDGVSAWRFAWRLVAGVTVVSRYGFQDRPQDYQFYFLGDDLVAVLAPQRDAAGRAGKLLATEFGGGGLSAEQAGLTPATPAQ